MQHKVKILSISFLWLSFLACAQSNKEIVPESYIAFKTTEPIKIDGIASEASWEKASWSNAFIDIEGVKKPKYNTQVKMLWDDRYFYILAKLEEPHVWATLKQRDTIIFYNNDFEVFIDPDGDTYNYYELEMNAYNTIWDLFINKPYREPDNVVLNDWTLTGLKSAIKINGTINNPSDTDEGWQVELAIPWAAYKTAYYQDNVPRDNFWRVDFSRVNWQHEVVNGKYYRKKDENGKFLPEYNWVWSPIGVINMHEPERWGYVYFSSKAIGSKDTFSIPKDDKVKWELYTLYKAQKAYYNNHQSWATSLDSISTAPIYVDGKLLKPSLENHATGFNIAIKSPFSNKTLIIKENGKIISK